MKSACFLLALAGLAVGALGCRATIPEGRYGCADGDPCPPGQVCADGLCVGEAPGIDAGRDAEISMDGSPHIDSAMPDAQIDVDGGTDDAATPCVPRCDGNELVECDESGHESRVPCSLGCIEHELRCARLQPSNLPDLCMRMGLPELDIGGDTVHTIDTSADCEEIIPQEGGPDICLHIYSRVQIGPDAMLVATPGVGSESRPLAIVGIDEMIIDGELRARWQPSGLSGPGAVETGLGGRGALSNAAGGGGGGFGSTGGRGGSGMGGTAGSTYGSNALVPLVGGSAGGVPGHLAEDAGVGGGGAIQLVSCGPLTIRGIIDANGGGGYGATACGGPSGGYGGGSGGAVLLEAEMLQVSGVVTANGGGGGGGGGTSGLPSGCPSGDSGTNGQQSTEVAPGGMGHEAGLGGNGAALGVGATGGSYSNAGGGGGGGVGRIRFNSPSGAEPDLSGAVISPAPSRGVVGPR